MSQLSAPPTQAAPRTRSPLSVFDVLVAAGLIVLAIGTYGVERTHFGQQDAIALVFVALPLVLAALVLFRVRAMRVVAAAVAAMFVLGAVFTDGEMFHLTHPAELLPFASIVTELVGAVVVLVAGVAAALRRRLR